MTRPSVLSATVSALVLAACSGAVLADNVINENTVIRNNLCVGYACLDTESYPGSAAVLRLKYQRNRIELDDTSADGGSFPNNDWALLFNDDASGGESYFSVSDETADRRPFTVEAGAPENALRVAADGKVGFGTAFPQQDLHVAAGGYPSILLEDLGYAVGPQHIWRMVASDFAYVIIDETHSSNAPFLIRAYSEDDTLRIENSGIVAIGGSFAADATLHVRRDDGSAKLRVQEQDAATAPRTLLDLQNNGRPEIVLGNSATSGEWSFGAGTNFILKQGALGSESSAKTKLFEIQPDGDAVLAGTLTTGGTTCGGGCDRVFSDGYDLPSIRDHADLMFALGHLPNVGATIENAPVNVTDKLGRVLNELEHAHIYIARQQDDIVALQDLTIAQAAAIAELRGTVEALSAQD